MPNWCENIVTVTGPAETLKTFVEFVKGKNDNDSPLSFSFESVLPTPPNLLNEGWYEWRLENWGTKWDLSDMDEEEIIPEDGYCRWSFYTAWGPADGICTILRDKFPDLHISWFYHEPGCEIAGYL